MDKLLSRLKCLVLGHQIEATQLVVAPDAIGNMYIVHPPGPIFCRCRRCGKDFMPAETVSEERK